MKKFIPIILALFILLAGCNAAPQPTEIPEPQLQIGNPWKSYETMTEAESACSVDFPIPDKVTENLKAESYRVMSNSLMEVTYRDVTGGDCQVTVRMQSGEGQDISGVYGEPDSIETKQINGTDVAAEFIGQSCLYLISKDGYSYSLYAPNGIAEETADIFLSHIY